MQKRQEISKLYREAEAANNAKEPERLKKWYWKLSDTNIKRLIEQMAAFKGWPENGRVDNGQGWGDNKERGPEGAGENFKAGSFDDLPSTAQNSYKGYEGNGWKGNYSGQTPGTNAGRAWGNELGDLPTIDRV